MKTCLFTLLLFTFFFTSCASDTTRKKKNEYVRIVPIHEGVDKEFRTFVRKFQDKTDKGYTALELTIGFKEKPYPVIGQCYWVTFFKREIDIDPYYWQSSSELEKQSLIDHEMGHCVCHRLHSPTTQREWYDKALEFLGIIRKEGFLYDGCPDSLMHFGNIPEKCLIQHKTYYDTEMKYFCN